MELEPQHHGTIQKIYETLIACSDEISAIKDYYDDISNNDLVLALEEIINEIDFATMSIDTLLKVQ